MENQEFKKLLKFNGDNSKAVGMFIINQLLTLVTLGIYYPWAKATTLKYTYGESEYLGTRFEFHGTGKEMFIGFLKAIGVIILFYALMGGAVWVGIKTSMAVAYLIIAVAYIGFLLLIPAAIHGSNKYRLSRSSWRGIHFGYRGDLKEFTKLFLKEMFLTIVTIGIYASWFHVSMRKYVLGHTRFGNVEFKFIGIASELFVIRLKGIILTILTLGIYGFWYMKDVIAYEVNNTKIVQGEKEISIRSTLTGGDIFVMFVTNYLIIIFTLGIGFGIALNRIMRVTYSNIEFDSEIDTNNLVQTEEEYKDAAGDDMLSMLDISI